MPNESLQVRLDTGLPVIVVCFVLEELAGCVSQEDREGSDWSRRRRKICV